MAKEKKSPRRSAAGSTVPARKRIALSALAGAFAYRFSGYVMKQDRPWWLTGVGRFEIDAQRNLTGAHRCAIMPISGQAAALVTGVYALKGSISIGTDRTGDATILFTRTGGSGQDVKGQFYVTLAEDENRLWFISSGAVVPGTGEVANESVTLEAVRVAN